MLIERKWKKWVYFYLPMAVFILFTLFPFYWMAVTAFRPDAGALPHLAPAERRAAVDARADASSTSRACCRPPRSRPGCGTRC